MVTFAQGASGTELTRRSALRLARAIRAREVTSAEVVEAHIELLRRFQPRTRALAAERFDEARAEAAAADERIAAAADGDELPPLLGVPCTIKEAIQLAGQPNCSGLVARADHRCDRNAPVVERILGAGAIPLGVTNTSELCMWIESENRVYGRTSSAYSARRTAGGSSGGEGAAVGSGGAPFGIGSDVGGSIRFPAFCNGVFGHKPSPGLVPNSGSYPTPTGGVWRLLGTGPIARRAEDLMPILRLIAGPHPDDDFAADMELGEPGDVSLDGLRVTLAEDFYVRPYSRELMAARDRAAAALATAGARVERVSMKRVRTAFAVYLAVLEEASDLALSEVMAEEGVARLTVRDAVRRSSAHTVPMRITLLLERFSKLSPERRTRRLLAAGRSLAREIQELIGDGVMLHPTHPRPAPRHGTTFWRPWTVMPTAIFNLAEVPGTQVPLGFGRSGLPLGTQVIAGPGRDHVSIAVALELERRLGGWSPPALSG